MWLVAASAAREGFAVDWQLAAAVVALLVAVFVAGVLIYVGVPVVLVVIAAAALVLLAASWVGEWAQTPSWLTWLRDGSQALRRDLRQIGLLRQLTGGWDWQRLRLGVMIWVGLEALGLWTTERLPIPVVSSVSTVAVFGLAILQYTAVGGGQPVWALEHLLVHLLDFAGVSGADIEALRHFARENLAARTYEPIQLPSQALLALVAYSLSYGIRSLFRLISK